MNNLPMLFAVLIACVLGLVLVRRVLGDRPTRPERHAQKRKSDAPRKF